MQSTTVRLAWTQVVKPSPGNILGLILIVFLASASQQSTAQNEPYTRAETLIRDHQWDEGLSVLGEILKQSPKNLKALNLAGLALIGKGNTQAANKYFLRALAINPRFVPALKNLSINEFDAHDDAAANKHLEAAEKVTPQDPLIHFYLGEISYRQGKYQLAVDNYVQIDQLATRNPRAGAHQVICYLRLRDASTAKEALSLLPIDRLDPKTQFDLALALDDAGMATDAVPLIDSVYARFPSIYDIAMDRLIIELDARKFTQAIESATNLSHNGDETAEVDNLLAEAYAGNSQFQLAFETYRKAIHLAPEEEENYIDLASLCLSRRSFEAGVRVVDVGLIAHPDAERLLFMRGLIHATEGDYESAEQDFKLSEKGSHKDLGAIGLGASFLQNGEYDRAIEVIRAKLQERPNDPNLLYLFAATLIHSGADPGEPRFKEAQLALEKSIRYDPNLCLPHIELGKIYLDEKLIPEAAQQFERARSIDPTERSAYAHLAVAYRRLGQVERAKEVLGVLEKMSEQDHMSEMERFKANTQGATSQSLTAPLPK